MSEVKKANRALARSVEQLGLIVGPIKAIGLAVRLGRICIQYGSVKL